MTLKDEQVKELLGKASLRKRKKRLIFSDPEYDMDQRSSLRDSEPLENVNDSVQIKSETNRRQIEDESNLDLPEEPETNRGQFFDGDEANSGKKQGTNWRQTGDGSRGSQVVKSETKKRQIEDNKSETNRRQTEDADHAIGRSPENKATYKNLKQTNKLETNKGQTEDILKTSFARNVETKERQFGDIRSGFELEIPETNQRQNEDILEEGNGFSLETNRRQSRDDGISFELTKLPENQRQTEDILRAASLHASKTKEKESDNIGTEFKPEKLEINRRHAEDSLLEEYKDKSKTNQRQTRDRSDILSKNESSIPRWSGDASGGTKGLNFSYLVGLQRKIVLLVFMSCQSSRSEFSEPLSVEHIAEQGKINYLSVKKTIQRLEKKGVIERGEFKAGRSGWTRYRLNYDIYQEILMLQAQGRLLELSQNNKPSFGESFKNNNSNDEKTELELKQETVILTDEWDEIDISPLAKYGFSKMHLWQIKNDNKLPPEYVEQSIKAFSFDLEINQKGNGIKDPLKFFMGILRKGNPYAPPSNYETEQERTMKEFIEKQKIINEKRKQLNEEAFKLAYENWLSSLSQSEIQSLLPPGIKLDTQMAKESLKSKFRKEIWEEINNKFM